MIGAACVAAACLAVVQIAGLRGPARVGSSGRIRGSLRWGPEAMVGLVWAIAMAPVLVSLTQLRPTPGFDANDHIFHMLFTERFDLRPLSLPLPQLFHSVLIWGVKLVVPPLSLLTASTVVMVAFAGLQGAVVVWFLRRPTAEAAPGATITWACAGALAFLVVELPQFALLRERAFDGERLAASLHQWNTPTSIVVAPLQVLLFVLVVEAITHPRRPRRTGLILGLVLATGFTMPAPIISLAAGLVPWILLDRRRDQGDSGAGALRRERVRERAAVAARVLWAPTAVVLVVQLIWFRTLVDPEIRTTLAFAPFEVVGSLRLAEDLPVVLANLIGALVFPVVGLALGGRALRTQTELRLLGWCVLAGLGAFLLFAQTGTVDQNMGRIAFAPYFLVNLAVLRHLLAHGREIWQRSLWHRVGLVTLGGWGLAALATGAALHLERSDLLTFTGTVG